MQAFNFTCFDPSSCLGKLCDASKFETTNNIILKAPTKGECHISESYIYFYILLVILIFETFLGNYYFYCIINISTLVVKVLS